MENLEERLQRLLRSDELERAKIARRRAEIARRPTPKGIARGHSSWDIAVRAVDAELRERPSKELERLRVDLLSVDHSRSRPWSP